VSAMAEAWDVAVVGAGFSGSLAAYELARKGLRVVVVERGKQIGHETSGGNLSDSPWWNLSGIRRPDFLIPVIRRDVAWLGRGFIVASVRPHPHGELSAFARPDLDVFLLDALRGAGVELLGDFCAEELVTQPGGPIFLRAANRTVAARAAVIAAGSDEEFLVRNGFMRRRAPGRAFFVSQQRLLGAPGAPREGAALLELQNLPGFRDAVASVLRLSNETVVTIRGVVEPEALANWSFHPVDVMSRLKGHPMLEHLFACTAVGDWRTRILGGFPPVRRRVHGERVLVVGEAARPLSGSWRPGSGFRWAAFSAHEAAATLAATLDRPTRFRLRAYAERLHAAGRVPLRDRWIFPWRRVVALVARAAERILFWLTG
jgi:flavin-dependent dehydrogenase